MADNKELIVCGWDEVFILDFNKIEDGSPQKTWSWTAEGCEGLPEDFKSLFKTTDECKPFDNGKKVLITSSGGAVVYVDRLSNAALFYARADNAHSADLLPNNRVIVAASHKPDGEGDRLILFDMDKPDHPLWHDELSWCHGAVWDEQRQILWGLATDAVHEYQLKDWDSDAPSLALESVIQLHESGGHDMYPIPGSEYLGISTANHCWYFDRDKRSIMDFPHLAHRRHVKSISMHPETKHIVYVHGNDECWWSDTLHFLNPQDEYHIADEHFYKARWNIKLN